jgi:hypothetical protein
MSVLALRQLLVHQMWLSHCGEQIRRCMKLSEIKVAACYGVLDRKKIG